jgi:hypothetical protein
LARRFGVALRVVEAALAFVVKKNELDSVSKQGHVLLQDATTHPITVVQVFYPCGADTTPEVRLAAAKKVLSQALGET